MRILITGSSIMVGRNFLESPRSKNYEILAPSHKELDLLDKEMVGAYLKKVVPTW